MKSGILKLALLGVILCAGIFMAGKEMRELRRDRENLSLKNSEKSDRIESLKEQIAELREHRDRNKRMYLQSRDAELKFKQAWLDQEGLRFRPVVSDPALAHLDVSQKQSIDGFRSWMSELLYSQRDSVGAMIIGRGGWLYLKNELHEANCATSIYEEALEGIQNIHQSLQDRGIQLVFCPLPTKWELHPEGIDSTGFGDVDLNPQRSVFVQQLRDAGITCVDLAPTYREAIANDKLDSAYFKEDTHWTPEAIAFAADSVAQAIRSHPDWDAGESVTLTRQRRRGALQEGDLSMMLPDDSGFERQPEPFEFDEVVGYENRPGRVLVTGRSFTAIDPAGATNAGLAPQLAFRLNSNVQHLYGGTGALRTLLREEPQRASELRFVVWVVPGRDFWESDQLFSPDLLTRNMFGDRTVQTKQPEPTQTPELLVTAASPELARSDLIYRELISSFVVSEPGKEPRVYYYHLIKDRKLLLPRFIRKGDRIRVEGIPWQDHLKEHPEFERFAIQDSLSDLDQEIFYVRRWLSDPPAENEARD